MKIRDFTGGILEIKQVKRVVEKRVEYNGRIQRFVEVVKDAKLPANGLAFVHSYGKRSVGFPMEDDGSQNFIILNLTQEKAEEIIDALATTGYYNLASLEYQKRDFDTKPFGFDLDDGQSNAYVEDDFTIKNKVFHEEYVCLPFETMPSDIMPSDSETQAVDIFGEEES